MRRSPEQEVDDPFCNPYWEAVRDLDGGMFNSDGRWSPDPFQGLMKNLNDPDRNIPLRKETVDRMIERGRQTMVERYSWAIPHPDALAWMVQRLGGRPVVEVGAGTGYWAWMLSQRGVDVRAYDIRPPKLGGNAFHSPSGFVDDPVSGRRERVKDLTLPGEQYFNVRHGTHRVLSRPSTADRVLFLSWPPYSKPFGVQALRRYTGNMFFYIGEFDGCCGDDALFEELKKNWTEVESCDSHIQWDGLHDYFVMYQRKPTRRMRTARGSEMVHAAFKDKERRAVLAAGGVPHA